MGSNAKWNSHFLSAALSLYRGAFLHGFGRRAHTPCTRNHGKRIRAALGGTPFTSDWSTRVQNVPCVTRLHGQAYGYRAHGLTVVSDGAKRIASVIWTVEKKKLSDSNFVKHLHVSFLFFSFDSVFVLNFFDSYKIYHNWIWSIDCANVINTILRIGSIIYFRVFKW